MKRLLLAIFLATAGGSGLGLTAHPVLAASLCVGSGPGCYPTIQQALTVAQNGDVIHIGTGAYAGPITILKSVSVIGAGAGVTTIQGGGPVVTIGSADLTSEPTVSVTGVTMTGGVNTSVPDRSQPFGGGIWVPPSATGGPGATVTLTDSVVTRSRVTSLGSKPCGPDPTPTCSGALGGGIANFGTMTLTNTTVSNNTAAWDVRPAGDFNQARGGGIYNPGTMTLRNSTVTGNTVSFVIAASSPLSDNASGGGISDFGALTIDGGSVSGNTVHFDTSAAVNMFAGGGGIVDGGTLTLNGGTVSTNTVTMTSTSTDPNSVLDGNGGGVRINDFGSATIRDSLISGNRITATANGGSPGVNGGGIDDDNVLTLVNSTVRDNRASTTITSTQPGSFGGSGGGGIDIDGPTAIIQGTTLSGNSATATGGATAFALAGAVNSANGQTVTLTDSIVAGNTARATTDWGAALVQGGGINNFATTLILRNTLVTNNTTAADGSSGHSQGGGIWNDSAFLLGGPPDSPSHLSLYDSTITRNQATASSTITPHGGGVYNGADDGATVAVNDSVIAQNVPDQCYSC